MDVAALRCRPIERVAELPFRWWSSVHVLLYLGVGAVVATVLDLGSGLSLPTILGDLIISVAWFAPLLVVAGIAATVCLGALRLLSDVRWYWFRLAAILLFAVPLPLFLWSGSGSAEALRVGAIQLVTALLIVQPRERTGVRADHLR